MGLCEKTKAAVREALGPGHAFKVIKDGTSFHGGSHKWSLPRGDKPGAWAPKREPRLCHFGYHLTDDPRLWWAPGARCFVAEYDGAVDGEFAFGSDRKIAVARARLVRAATTEELAAFGVFVDGSHTVEDAGEVFADGDARVSATGRSTVKVTGRARATVSFGAHAFIPSDEEHAGADAGDGGTATVYAGDVAAHDDARVSVYGRASATLHGRARAHVIRTRGPSLVRAYDLSVVDVAGTANVEAYGMAIVVVRSNDDVKVRLSERAVKIDQSAPRPRMFRAKAVAT